MFDGVSGSFVAWWGNAVVAFTAVAVAALWPKGNVNSWRTWLSPGRRIETRISLGALFCGAAASVVDGVL